MANLAKSRSELGFGGYRISDEGPGAENHKKSLEQAIHQGVRLIDTSSNYSDGGSERLIGKVLKVLDPTLRKEITLVTKAGYVQGQNMDLARQREREGKPFSDMVKFSNDCWHCISPDFLEDQLTRSLTRLQLDRVDTLLLHNPEYFLKAGGSHAEYYARIGRAFAHLEGEVARGRISKYGVSSNTFPEDPEDAHFTSLERVWNLAETWARETGRPHHFKVIQFPLNLFEAGAYLGRNNSGKTVLEFAQGKGLTTLANRPLNSFTGQEMLRLADFPAHHGRDTAAVLQQAFQRAIQMESELKPEWGVPPREIAWAHILKQNAEALSHWDTWKSVLEWQARPLIREAQGILKQGEKATPESRTWIEAYLPKVNALFDAFTAHLEATLAIRSRQLSQILDRVAPELKTSPSLSQKSLRIYASMPGLTCTLLGMRNPSYVEDALSKSGQPPLSPAILKNLFETLAKEIDQ